MSTHECAAQKTTIFQKISQWIFPATNLSMLDEEFGFAPGYLSTKTVCVFDWKDRIRIMVSGKVEVTTHTKTDVSVNKSRSISSVYVLPPNSKIHAVDA